MSVPDPTREAAKQGAPKRSARRPSDWRADLARYSGLGLTFGLTVTLFALGGWWLDGKVDSSPWFLLLGTALGFTGALISLVKKLPSGS